MDTLIEVDEVDCELVEYIECLKNKVYCNAVECESQCVKNDCINKSKSFVQ